MVWHAASCPRPLRKGGGRLTILPLKRRWGCSVPYPCITPGVKKASEWFELLRGAAVAAAATLACFLHSLCSHHTRAELLSDHGLSIHWCVFCGRVLRGTLHRRKPTATSPTAVFRVVDNHVRFSCFFVSQGNGGRKASLRRHEHGHVHLQCLQCECWIFAVGRLLFCRECRQCGDIIAVFCSSVIARR